MVEKCYSYRTYCSLDSYAATPHGPTQGPGRKLGDAYGKIGSFYFYEKGSNDDAAFGFFESNVGSEHCSRKVRVRTLLRCRWISDLSRRWARHPIKLAIMADGRVGSNRVSGISRRQSAGMRIR